MQTPASTSRFKTALSQVLQSEVALSSGLLCALLVAAVLSWTPLGQTLEQSLLATGLRLRPAPPPHPSLSVVVLRGQAQPAEGVSVRQALAELLELLASSPEHAPGAVLVDVLLSEQEPLWPPSAPQSSWGTRIQLASTQLGRVLHTVSVHPQADRQHTRSPELTPLKPHLLRDEPRLALGPVATYWELASPLLARSLYPSAAAVGNIGFLGSPEGGGLLLHVPLLSRVLVPAPAPTAPAPTAPAPTAQAPTAQAPTGAPVLELPETALLPSLALAGAALMRCVPPNTRPAPGWLQACLQPTPQALLLRGEPVPLDPQGQLLLSYRRAFQLIPTDDGPVPVRGKEVLSFRDSGQGGPRLVLPDGTPLSAADLEGRGLLVLDAQERQTVLTPLGAAFPPATAHAQALSALLSQDWLHPVPLFWQLVLTASSLWLTFRLRARSWGVQTSLTLVSRLEQWGSTRLRQLRRLLPALTDRREGGPSPAMHTRQSLLDLTRGLLHLLLLLLAELLWTPELLLLLGWGLLSLGLLCFTSWWLPVVPSMGALMAAGIGWRLASGWQLEQEQSRARAAQLALDQEVLPVANNVQALHDLRTYEALEQVLPPHELEALDRLLEVAFPLLGTRHADAVPPTSTLELGQQVQELRERLGLALARMKAREQQAHAAQQRLERMQEQAAGRESVFALLGRMLTAHEPPPEPVLPPSEQPTRAQPEEQTPTRAQPEEQTPTRAQPDEQTPTPARESSPLVSLQPPEVPEEQLRLAERYGLFTRHPGLLAFVWDVVHHLSGRRELPILLLGESGTGKGLLAKLVHRASQAQDPGKQASAGGERPASPAETASSQARARVAGVKSAPERKGTDTPAEPLPDFQAVNCAHLTPELMLATLCGYKKGAFTGAVSDKPSCFETAGLGTTFLDEAGELSLEAQKAMLKIIDEREVIRLGESIPRPLNTRIVLATHQPLEARVEQGLFRNDLYHRINTITFEVPALRERPYDVPVIAEAFLAQNARHSPLTLSPAALERLQQHDWKGNVRELHNVLERLLLFGKGPIFQAEQVSEALVPNARWKQERLLTGHGPQLPEHPSSTTPSTSGRAPPPEPLSVPEPWELRLGSMARGWLEKLREHRFDLATYAQQMQLKRQRADAQLRNLMALALVESQLELSRASQLLADPLEQEVDVRLRERLQTYLKGIAERYGPHSERAQCSEEELGLIFSKDYGTFTWAPVRVVSLLRQSPPYALPTEPVR